MARRAPEVALVMARLVRIVAGIIRPFRRRRPPPPPRRHVITDVDGNVLGYYGDLAEDEL